MTEIFRVDDYQDRPVYNIRAVEQATGLTAPTLRAWERRYGVCEPQRTDSGYRLYSERDVAMLRWLKRRVDEGMAISQAVALLQLRQKSSGEAEVTAAPVERSAHAELRRRLIEALLDFDESGADRIMSESFALHGVESSCEWVLAPAMVEIGERWHRGEVSVVAEHFASHYVRRKLESMVNVTPVHQDEPAIVLGCAPGDWHEVGLVLLSFFLRRQGHHVIYLGQNVPEDHLLAEMQRLRPAMVILSAATAETAVNLAHVAAVTAGMSPPRPIFGFGGRAFNRHPELRADVAGHFLGESTVSAVSQVQALLRQAA